MAYVERRHGRLDIQVSNAGIAERTRFLETSVAQFERVLRVNLTGAPVDPGDGGAVLPAWGIDVPDDAS